MPCPAVSIISSSASATLRRPNPTCEPSALPSRRHPPELLWKPDYQHHPNGALRVVEVVMSAPEPTAHRGFLEHMTESAAELAPGRLTIGETGNRITVLNPLEIARRLPGVTAD